MLHALRASEFKYRTILEELDLGFVEVDKDGVVQKVHSRFAEITGYSTEDLVGTTGDFLLDDAGKRMMAEVMENRRRAVSYTHLTLPTTPYV